MSGLLARLIGAEAARQFRERMTAAAPPAAPAGRLAVRSVPAPSPRPATIPAPPDSLGPASLDLSDFPTSILATATRPAPPLLTAFASGPALLAAIVFSEALAPPVALR